MTIRRIFVIALTAGTVLLGGCGSGDEPAALAPDMAANSPSTAAGAAPTSTAAATVAPARPMLEQTLAYGEGARSNLVGYLAMPGDAAEPLPGIIVIHEWRGLDDEIRATARRLAAEGYVVLAVDLYAGKTAATPEAAQPLMTALFAEPDAAYRNLQQAYDYLEKYALAPRIASIGWDLGGGFALQTALLFPGALDAAVMYYGAPLTDSSRLSTINTPILGFYGGLDQSIPARQAQDFRTVLQDLGKNADIRIYPRAGHEFANPNGANYDEEAAKESWELTLAFLARHLKLDVPTQ